MNSGMYTIKTGVFLLLPLLLAIVLLRPASVRAQPDPRHPRWQEVPALGTLYGDELEDCTSCEFGRAIGSVGDLDNSGVNDFIVARKRANPNGLSGQTLLLYKGIVGRYPSIGAYQEIGAREFGAQNSLLAVGDWDNNGWRDLCVEIALDNDTSEGNIDGKRSIGRMVIFWNDGTGNFSLNDTTRLPNPLGTSDAWSGAEWGLSYDWSGDGIDDLLIRAFGAFANGERLLTAWGHLYHGKAGKRWGRETVAPLPDWEWYAMPTHRLIQMKDQNCDGIEDLIFLWQGGSAATRNPSMTICYGNSELDAPDTNDCVTIEFHKQAGGNWASLLDVTGDNVLDLVLACSDSRYRVYAGEPGMRIDSVFGSGNDPPDPEGGRNYARPWAAVPMPDLVDETWGTPRGGPIFELGDVDLDGADDIVAFTSRYLCIWRVVNLFDSLIDGYISEPGILHSVVSLGDIDSSGLPTYAVGYYTGGSHSLYAGAINFYKPSAGLLPTTGKFRTPPHPMDVGDRCDGTSRVEESRIEPRESAGLAVHVVPNPSSSEVAIEWESQESGDRSRTLHVRITDASGRTILTQEFSSTQERFLWNTSTYANGVYYATVTVADQSRTVPITLQK